MMRHVFAWKLFVTVAGACATGMHTTGVEAGDARNTGVTPGLAFGETAPNAWTFELDGAEVGQMVSYADVLYVVAGSDTLHALRTDGGKPAWSIKVGGERISGIACARHADADYIVATTYEGVVAIDRKTGAVSWKRNIKSGLAAPVIVEKRVYAGGYDGDVVALDLLTGRLLWQHDYLTDAPEDPPGFNGKQARFGNRRARPRAASCDGSTVYLSVFDQCRVIAVDCQTGKRRWAFQTQGWIYGRPTISEKFVFVGSQDEHFYGIDKQTGKLVWKFKTGARVEASCAVSDRHVYFGSCDANLYCVDKSTGKLQWKFATTKDKKHGGPIYAQPIVSGKTVYLPAMEGQVYALDAQTGKLNWRLRPSKDSQILDALTDGSRIYVSTRKNFAGAGEAALHMLGEP